MSHSLHKDSGATVLTSKQQMEKYKIYIVTWNVGASFPDHISLKNLLGLNTTTKNQHLPDIYVIGLMEVNAKPQEQVLDLFREEDPWTHKGKITLQELDYVFVKSEHMQGLLLSVYVRRKHIPHMYDIEAQFTRTGFGGLWGNKGAVSVRLNLYGCAITFVAAHLAAHDEHLDDRIEDYNQILEHHHYHVPHFREIFDHDYVFWFGDLNFRLQGEDSAAEVLEAVKQKQLEFLLHRDQLQHVRLNTREAFQLLREGTPTFPPTFKFKEGTNQYNLKRRPAWCDRILFAVQPSNRKPNMSLAIEQCSYKSHPDYSISDHKPVTSELIVKLYPNYRAPSIAFLDKPIWVIGSEFTVEYTKPIDFEEREHDWIGVYPVNFSSLNDHIAYEYVNEAESPLTPPDSPVDSFLKEASSTRRHGRRHNRKCHRLHCEQQAKAELVRIDFPDDIELTHGERYLLIYFQSTGTRGITSIGGVSKVFVAETSLCSNHCESQSENENDIEDTHL